MSPSVAIGRTSTQTSSVKFPCPLCGGPLEIAIEDIGKFAPCPHCGEEIPLEKPAKENFIIQGSTLSQYNQARNRSAAKAIKETDPETEQLVKVGYLLAIILPLIGFFFGFYLMFKNRPTEGVVCMVLSIVFSVIWGMVFINIF